MIIQLLITILIGNLVIAYFVYKIGDTIEIHRQILRKLVIKTGELITETNLMQEEINVLDKAMGEIMKERE